MDLDNFLGNSKLRFGFDSWPRRAESLAPSNIRAFALNPDALVGSWLFDQRQAHANGGYSDYFHRSDNPRQRAMAHVSTHQSHAEALVALLQNLTTSMAPALPRLDERGINLGDVGFCGYGENIVSLVFVRHHILSDIRSIGDVPVSVVDLARQIDDQIQISV